jgi:hypothetical protein
LPWRIDFLLASAEPKRGARLLECFGADDQLAERLHPTPLRDIVVTSRTGERRLGRRLGLAARRGLLDAIHLGDLVALLAEGFELGVHRANLLDDFLRALGAHQLEHRRLREVDVVARGLEDLVQRLLLRRQLVLLVLQLDRQATRRGRHRCVER